VLGTHLLVVVSHRKPSVQSVSAAHLSLHAAAPQAYGLHGVGVSALQSPLLLQLDLVAWPPVHDGVPHEVSLPG